MPTTLTTAAVEEGTYIITASFTDDEGAAVVPNSGLVWSLYKKVLGVETIVNSREDEALVSASEVTIVLSGDDLALTAGESNTRYVLIEGTYDSSAGNDLPLREQVSFRIDDLVGVA